MLTIINVSTQAALILSSVMAIISTINLFLGFIINKKANERFKREEMDAKADMPYVIEENKKLAKMITNEGIRITTETNLKIQVISESQEEFKTLIETMSEQINYIYKKHWKETL